MNKINLAGCVIIKNDAILLLNRIKTDWYELPGGKIDGKELPKDAAKRELKEELLCDIEIIKKLGRKDFTENGFKMTYHWFLAKLKRGQTFKIGEPDEFRSFRFIPLIELSNHKLSPNMQNFLSYFKKNKFHGELSIKEDSKVNNLVKEIIFNAINNYAKGENKKLKDILKVELNIKRKKCKECRKIPKEFIVLSNVLTLKKSLFVCPQCGAPFVVK